MCRACLIIPRFCALYQIVGEAVYEPFGRKVRFGYDMHAVEAPGQNTQWWPSGLIEKLRSISLVSSDETSSSKGSRGQHDVGSLAFQIASQTLWDTGKLAEPIPDGFYFVSPERRFKELFDTIPSIDELQTLDSEGLRPNVILVDTRKDKKLSMLKQLAITLVKGLNSNPSAMIKKIAGLVCDFFKRPKLETDHVKGALEEVSHALDSQGIHMLGHIKHGSCHSRAILFKVLADTVGLESMLMVGLPREGVMERTDTYKHISVIVVLNSVELLVDLGRNPGKLLPCSAKAVFLSHLSAGESDSAENDSYDSPIEPNSPLCGFSDQTEVEGPEHPFFRGHGRSLLGGRRHSFGSTAMILMNQDNIYLGYPYSWENNEIGGHGRSAGASPVEARRRRRRCISMIPEIGDDTVRECVRLRLFLILNGMEQRRVVREMNEILKRNRLPEEQVNSTLSCSTSGKDDNSDLRESVSRLSPDGHDGIYGQKPLTYNFPLKQINSHKAISLPSSPQHFVNQASLRRFFGEVFRGTWNGLEVGIKVFLEQDLTPHSSPNVILFLGACMEPPRLSIVTEYMEMGSLYYLIHASGMKKKLSWQRRLKMLCDICSCIGSNSVKLVLNNGRQLSMIRGLMSIHRMKIVHRDLKSANCLVNKHWTVKICDFGLSRVLTTRPMKDSSSAGTPEWMAPELIRNEPFTEKCDIFSLGVIMWELCTLNRPWEGVPAVQVVYAVGNDGQRLEIPEGPLGKLIADCWAEPDERPSCSASWFQSFRALQMGQSRLENVNDYSEKDDLAIPGL
ncbi:hypothetical protein DH2020_042028 [Rehmannia glutinosa]|uniref:Protein kinase domain-containing protein n=1 Tax=Rehmannia glutinosa TaxID=99300 RepID=A0ABR0UPD4_REHGL